MSPLLKNKIKKMLIYLFSHIVKASWLNVANVLWILILCKYNNQCYIFKKKNWTQILILENKRSPLP